MDLVELRNIIACPACRNVLADGSDGIYCSTCDCTYPLVEGRIPLLFPQERAGRFARFISDHHAGDWKQLPWARWASHIKPPSAYYDPGERDRLQRFLQLVGPGGKVVDFGAGGRKLSPQFINFDIDRFPNVDIIGDGHRFPFQQDSLDGVVITGVLEHVEAPEIILRELFRALKPQGCVYVVIPFIQGFHADPIDHQRFTLQGLRKLCDAFEEVDAGVAGGPSSALVWILREYAAVWFRNKYLYYGAKFISGWLSAPLKYLDHFLAYRPHAHIIASGLYFIGRKPALQSQPTPDLSGVTATVP